MRHVAVAAALLLAAPLTAQTTPVQVPEVRATPAQPAVAKPHVFGWVLEGALEFGGDELFTIIFTDGSEQTIHAGQGGTIAFGAEWRPPTMPQLGLRGTLGYKFTTTAAEDANITFTRVPIEVVASYYLPRDWRVGAGLAYHTAIAFNGDGFLDDENFDPAAGATLELGWKVFSLSYTALKYEAPGGSVDASAFGLAASWVFGKR